MSRYKIKIIKKKGTMQTNNKLNLAEEMFGTADAINKVSRTGSLYGQLFAIKDMQIHLLQEETKIKKEIESEERK